MDIQGFESIQDFLPSSAGVTQLDTGQMLGKEDFLTLLLAELSNQNPLEPVDNKDLILQLAQFSTIEQTQSMNENFEKFITSSNIDLINNMIGKDIEYLDLDSGDVLSGKVDKLNINNGDYKLVVDGKEVTLANLISISNPTTPSTPN